MNSASFLISKTGITVPISERCSKHGDYYACKALEQTLGHNTQSVFAAITMVIICYSGFQRSQPLYFQKFLSYYLPVVHFVLQRSVFTGKKLLYSKWTDLQMRRPPAMKFQGHSGGAFLVFISLSSRELPELNSTQSSLEWFLFPSAACAI